MMAAIAIISGACGDVGGGEDTSLTTEQALLQNRSQKKDLGDGYTRVNIDDYADKINLLCNMVTQSPSVYLPSDFGKLYDTGVDFLLVLESPFYFDNVAMWVFDIQVIYADGDDATMESFFSVSYDFCQLNIQYSNDTTDFRWPYVH
jgi:hypothetical protein